MSTPRSRARWLRGGLVGACSVVATTGAHAAAVGELPHDSAIGVAALVCLTAGAAVARIRLEARRGRLLGVVVALLVVQALGHLSLYAGGGHHHSAELLGLTPAMIAAHAAAALVLGAAIVSVEYLYVVCVSVLRWLRLFAVLGLRPLVRILRCTAKVPFAQSVWVLSGLGMRAPPMMLATAA